MSDWGDQELGRLGREELGRLLKAEWGAKEKVSVLICFDVLALGTVGELTFGWDVDRQDDDVG